MRRKRWGHRSFRFPPHKYLLVTISVILQKTQSKTCCSACQTRPRVRLMRYHDVRRGVRATVEEQLTDLRVFISEELYRYKHSYFWNWLKLCWKTLWHLQCLRDQPVCDGVVVSVHVCSASMSGLDGRSLRSPSLRRPTRNPRRPLWLAGVHHLAGGYRTPEQQRRAVVFIWDTWK